MMQLVVNTKKILTIQQAALFAYLFSFSSLKDKYCSPNFPGNIFNKTAIHKKNALENSRIFQKSCLCTILLLIPVIKSELSFRYLLVPHKISPWLIMQKASIAVEKRKFMFVQEHLYQVSSNMPRQVLCLFLAVLGSEARVSCLVGKHSTTELNPQSCKQNF